MNRTMPMALSLLTFACGARAEMTLLYDNTKTDTGDTILYSIGPYTALGDQIHLDSPGLATQALVQMFNNGSAGTFDAELDFFQVGAPVGSELGSFDLTGIASLGSDVINLTFGLGATLSLPQDVIFTVAISNLSPGMDLGLDMFEPPTVGSSDNTFMIAEGGGVYSHLATNYENVYFQLSGPGSANAPESGSLALLLTCIPAMAMRFGWLTTRRPKLSSGGHRDAGAGLIVAGTKTPVPNFSTLRVFML